MARGSEEGLVDIVYALVVDCSEIRVALACLEKGAVMHHLGVNSACLNGELSEDDAVYVRSSHDLDQGFKQGEAMRLLKALYGWKRAPKFWSKKFGGAVRELGFKQLRSQ